MSEEKPKRKYNYKAKKPNGRNDTGRASTYSPDKCDGIIELMSKGYSKEAVAGHLNICQETLYRWIKDFPEFAKTIKEGMEKSRLFWEKIALDNLTHTQKGRQLNSTVWIFNMKNRFGWTDKREVELGEKTRDTAIKLAYNLDDSDDS
jgi:transposase-like protein